MHFKRYIIFNLLITCTTRSSLPWWRKRTCGDRRLWRSLPEVGSPKPVRCDPGGDPPLN